MAPPPLKVWTGDVTHAGVPVSAGTRHALVASFAVSGAPLSPAARAAGRVSEERSGAGERAQRDVRPLVPVQWKPSIEVEFER